MDGGRLHSFTYFTIVISLIMGIIMRMLCSECDRILKSGTQCDTCGRWFHNSCGNVKAQVVESGKRVCDKCRSERLRELEEKLQDTLQEIDVLTRKNKILEEQLQLVTAGRKTSRHEKMQGILKVVNA